MAAIRFLIYLISPEFDVIVEVLGKTSGIVSRELLGLGGSLCLGVAQELGSVATFARSCSKFVRLIFAGGSCVALPFAAICIVIAR